MKPTFSSSILLAIALAACSGGLPNHDDPMRLDAGGTDAGDAKLPEPAEVCAQQHPARTADGFAVVVCDQLFDQSPFVHLPKIGADEAFAGLQDTRFSTVDGRSIPVALTPDQQNAEKDRVRQTIYR